MAFPAHKAEQEKERQEALEKKQAEDDEKKAAAAKRKEDARKKAEKERLALEKKAEQEKKKAEQEKKKAEQEKKRIEDAKKAEFLKKSEVARLLDVTQPEENDSASSNSGEAGVDPALSESECQTDPPFPTCRVPRTVPGKRKLFQAHSTRKSAKTAAVSHPEVGETERQLEDPDSEQRDTGRSPGPDSVAPEWTRLPKSRVLGSHRVGMQANGYFPQADFTTQAGRSSKVSSPFQPLPGPLLSTFRSWQLFLSQCLSHFFFVMTSRTLVLLCHSINICFSLLVLPQRHFASLAYVHMLRREDRAKEAAAREREARLVAEARLSEREDFEFAMASGSFPMW